jgi:uncharacterized protein (DUF433 family)
MLEIANPFRYLNRRGREWTYMAARLQDAENWKRRLSIPAYRIGDAARYARTSAQTIGSWQRIRSDGSRVIGDKEKGEKLSYLQLIEVGVVAAMRRSGVSLKKIRSTREKLSEEFSSSFPFAEYRFKSDGKDLFVKMEEILDEKDTNRLLQVKDGQIVWDSILAEVLQEFEYDHEDFVVRWRLRGGPVVIDPVIAFGAPSVQGIPTWTIAGRWRAGENIDEIADDFCLTKELVERALEVEGLLPEYNQDEQ